PLAPRACRSRFARLTPSPPPPPTAPFPRAPLRPGWPPPQRGRICRSKSPPVVRAPRPPAFPPSLPPQPCGRLRAGLFPQRLGGIQVNLLGHSAAIGSSLGGALQGVPAPLRQELERAAAYLT